MCNHPNDAAQGRAALHISNTIPDYEISPYCTKRTKAAVYNPPKHKMTSCQYSHLLNNLGSKLIIGGDFNAKHPSWGSRTTTAKSQELWPSTVVTTNAVCPSNRKLTYWPSDHKQIVRLYQLLCLTSNLSQLHEDQKH